MTSHGVSGGRLPRTARPLRRPVARWAAALAVLALPAAAAAQADPLPLRPGVTGAMLHVDQQGRMVVHAPSGSPAGEAGFRGMPELLAVDGRPVAAISRPQVLTLLAGPVGSTVEVTVREPEGGAPRTVRVARAALLAPGPGYTEVVVTRHFVVHHRRTPAEAREAREMAEDTERGYARSGLPQDTEGRRAHLWISTSRPQIHQEAWVTTARQVGRARHGSVEELFPYLAYGDPGRLGEALGGSMASMATAAQGRWAHRAAARRMVRLREDAALPGAEPAMVAPPGAAGPARVRYEWGEEEASSLRHYLVARFGARRFGRLWRSNLDFGRAAPRELGVPAEAVLRGWREHVMALGPDPEMRMDPGAAAVALGWGTLALLWAVRLARRREVA